MSHSLRRFDIPSLQNALEAERLARGLTWPALTAEINLPFTGTPSIPISVSTLRTMADKSSVTSAVVLQVLRWLPRTPESFLIPPALPRLDELLPEPRPGSILRFDTRAMHTLLDDARLARGLTWRQLAAQLPDFSDSMLRNLASGPLIGFPRVMLIPQWLELPAAYFVRAFDR